MMNDVVVVVPVYQEKLSTKEMNFYNHNCKILCNYHFVLVAPDGLDVSSYINDYTLEVQYFKSHFFKNISGYNRLMMSDSFYKRFEEYRYMLICQTDALIFKDELLDWCRKDYDYIGAPWINKPIFLLQYVIVKKGIGYALDMLFRNNLFRAVGNGGLSLRKISSFIEALNLDKNAVKWNVNEDFYWSFFARIKRKPLSKPSAREAALFSIELNPKKLMKKQNNILPMGIHAWERYDAEFWQKHIGQLFGNNNDEY